MIYDELQPFHAWESDNSRFIQTGWYYSFNDIFYGPFNTEKETIASIIHIKNTYSYGTHLICDYSNVNSKLLSDEKCISEIILESVRQANGTLLNSNFHKFPIKDGNTISGITGVAILAESHISIHTWPEDGFAAVDIFMCGTSASPAKAAEYIAKRFKCTEYKLKVMERCRK